jgi:hypothetical protein
LQPIGCGHDDGLEESPKLGEEVISDFYRLTPDPCCSRKEVIQPHLPVRLPCYDFTPVMNLTVVSAPLAVRQPASGETHSHGVTGGVYKTRERIHRDIADPRLLAIPTSCSRVADCNPDYDALSGIGSPSRVGSPLYAPLYDV